MVTLFPSNIGDRLILQPTPGAVNEPRSAIDQFLRPFMPDTRQIDVYLLPELAEPVQLADCTAVVIDVLRATTTILHALAAGATQVMTSLLYGVEAVDPLTYAAVAAVLIGVAALASYVPARRASTVDPAESLAAE